VGRTPDVDRRRAAQTPQSLAVSLWNNQVPGFTPPEPAIPVKPLRTRCRHRQAHASLQPAPPQVGKALPLARPVPGRPHADRARHRRRHLHQHRVRGLRPVGSGAGDPRLGDVLCPSATGRLRSASERPSVGGTEGGPVRKEASVRSMKRCRKNKTSYRYRVPQVFF
jgi:hypothetical protein